MRGTGRLLRAVLTMWQRRVACLTIVLTMVLGMNVPFADRVGANTLIEPVPLGAPTPTAECTGVTKGAAQRTTIRMTDGVELEAWIATPDGCPGPHPVLVSPGPYYGQCYAGTLAVCDPTPEHPDWWTDEPPLLTEAPLENSLGFPPIRLVRSGYALLYVSVRGTGGSGGCFGLLDTREQRDQYEVVEWAASRDWSNGNVGMIALSYGTGDAFAAAVPQTDALKTVVAAGILTDFYTFAYTPQGASSSGNMLAKTLLYSGSTFVGPLGNGYTPTVESLEATARVAELQNRMCEHTREVFTGEYEDVATDGRDRAFYDERRLIDRFRDVEASVLVVSGRGDGHDFQDDEWWRGTPHAPKWFIQGPWGHEWPVKPEHLPTTFAADRPPAAECESTEIWCSSVLWWLDHWLKGVGPKPPIDQVDVVDSAGAWHTTNSWPPVTARDQVLYLRDDALSTTAGDGDATFTSAPDERNEHWIWDEALNAALGPLGAELTPPLPGLCRDDDLVAGQTSLRYLGEPASADVDIIGNPHAYLDLSSTQPGGLVHLWLLALAPGWKCDGSTPIGVARIAHGAADLRFHAANLDAIPFEGGHVRIDFTSTVGHVPAGGRLALVVSYGTALGHYFTTSYTPDITVHAGGRPDASHIVLPVASGSLDGRPPTLRYPPRPFVPVVASR